MQPADRIHSGEDASAGLAVCKRAKERKAQGTPCLDSTVHDIPPDRQFPVRIAAKILTWKHESSLRNLEMQDS
jgi:hypothetical protein